MTGAQGGHPPGDMNEVLERLVFIDGPLSRNLRDNSSIPAVYA